MMDLGLEVIEQTLTVYASRANVSLERTIAVGSVGRLRTNRTRTLQ